MYPAGAHEMLNLFRSLWKQELEAWRNPFSKMASRTGLKHSDHRTVLIHGIGVCLGIFGLALIFIFPNRARMFLGIMSFAFSWGIIFTVHFLDSRR
jgi:hypothetical protein